MNIFRENPEKTFMLLLVFGTLLMVGGVAVFRPINPEPEPKPQVDLSQDTMIIIPKVEDAVLPGVPDEARTYNMLGLETEGTYWWRCGDEWVQINNPCKQLTWLFGGEAYSFFPDVPNHSLQELCEEGIEQVCFNCEEVP